MPKCCILANLAASPYISFQSINSRSNIIFTRVELAEAVWYGRRLIEFERSVTSMSGNETLAVKSSYKRMLDSISAQNLCISTEKNCLSFVKHTYNSVFLRFRLSEQFFPSTSTFFTVKVTHPSNYTTINLR